MTDPDGKFRILIDRTLMMRDEQDRDLALSGLAEEIQARLATPAYMCLDEDKAFGPVRACLKAAREA